MKEPIIILASERSGTNLLRTLLGNHSAISAPLPAHLYASFFNLRKHYGDLREKQNILPLIANMKDLANHPYHQWNIEASPEDIFKENQPTSFQACTESLWQAKVLTDSKKVFVCKDILSFSHVTTIKANNPKTKFVYLARDPRDVVASWMKRPIAHFTVYNAAKHWAENQFQCLDAIYTQGIDAYTIKYEELITDPVNIMTNLLNYLEIEIEEECFQGRKAVNESQISNPYWENVGKPIIKDNFRKFEKQLTNEEVSIVETICREEMDHLGYDFTTDRSWEAPVGFEELNYREAEEKSKEMQPWIAEEMPMLLDKWKWLRELENKLVGVPSVTAIQNQTKSDSTQWIYKIRTAIKNRMRHVVCAVLGEGLYGKFRG
jgi:gluconate kinase